MTILKEKMQAKLDAEKRCREYVDKELQRLHDNDDPALEYIVTPKSATRVALRWNVHVTFSFFLTWRLLDS
jgi:hypothetical protein